MKNNWWKLLGAALVLYSIIGGMTVPLKPGLTNIIPSSIKTGQTVDFLVFGYNTNFDKAEDITVWLKADSSKAIQAIDVVPQSPTDLKVTFKLPNDMPAAGSFHPLSVVVNSKTDGISLLPGQVALQKGSLDTLNTAAWGEMKSLHRVVGFNFPYRNILVETIRSLYYHVPLWFAMAMIFMIAVVFSILNLYKPSIKNDSFAVGFTEVGVLLGILGTVTGAIWAKNTWGQYWSWDIKQNMSAIAIMVYLAYFVLRGSFEDREKSARISAVYNIFAFASLIPLLYIIPRLTESLHPGNGGNPGMGGEDLDNTMKYFLYPAFIGWFLLSMWMANIRSRFLILKDKMMLRFNQTID